MLCADAPITDISQTIQCGRPTVTAYYVYTCEDTGMRSVSLGSSGRCPHTPILYEPRATYAAAE